MNQEHINGIAHEVAFWAKFVQTDRFKQNWAHERINPELEMFVRDLIPVTANVLDVGSGPVSILHGYIKGGTIISADPLSVFYQNMVDFEGLGIDPPMPVAAENLLDVFSPGSFDVVHIRNAFDHCQNPVIAYSNLAGMVRKGGRLIIHGFENEAEAEKWQGLHQFNITVTDFEIIIKGKAGQAVHFEGNTSRRELPNGKTWFTFWI